MEQVFIYDCVRTPRTKARPGGGLYAIAPHDIVATLLRELPLRTGLDVRQVEDCLLGCVTPVADQGYNIAQASVLAAQWPNTVAAAQVNRYCASGLESVHMAASRIAAGWGQLIVAGGIEAMGRVPLGSDGGAILDNPDLILQASLIPQGVSADLIASNAGYSRDELDAYALQSQQRAATAIDQRRFDRSIVPVMDMNGLVLATADEHPRPSSSAAGLAKLGAAFAKTGHDGFDAIALSSYPHLSEITHVHTAGNSSGLVDGAALVVVGSQAYGESSGIKPRARILSMAVASSDATMMLLGMIPATQLALKRAGLTLSQIDVMEVNEAFAAVPLAFMEHFKVDDARINVNGGAIALGHPVGATGAILLGTLIDELERTNKRLGLVTLCAGGGQGIAAIIERIP